MTRLLRSVLVLLLGVLALLPLTPVTAAPREATPTRVTWQGIVITYNAETLRFAEVSPQDSARTQARLVEMPDPCAAGPVADCVRPAATFQLYPNRELNLRDWVSRYAKGLYRGVEKDFTDTVIGGRQAASFITPDEIAPEQWYIVPVGAEYLLLRGWLADTLVTSLRFTDAYRPRLASGQLAMTRLGRDQGLWTRATGGSRVYERPRLYGGSFVTILAMTRTAVQVRTSEDVTGWIRAPAGDALTTTATLAGELARFPLNGSARVVLPNGVPLRAAPRSTAASMINRMPLDKTFQVVGVRGDWARVRLETGVLGWVRTVYDGTRYLAPIK